MAGAADVGGMEGDSRDDQGGTDGRWHRYNIGLKLLVVTNDFPPRVGGIEDFVRRLVEHLSPATTSVVLASHHKDAAQFDRTFPHKVVRWPRFPMLPTPGLAREVARLCESEQADAVLFGASMPVALIAGSVARRTGRPIIACTHGVEPGVAQIPGARLLMTHIARHATLITVVSAWAEEHLRAAIGPAPRIEHLPSGIDTARFHPGVSADAVRRRHRLGQDPVVVCVARLVARKGQDQLIRALPLIAAVRPDVKLLIVGDGPDRRRLERLAEQTQVSSRVVFAGMVSYEEVPAYLAAGDVFAMPCGTRLFGWQSDALPAVFLQAAAVGRAAISGRAGGSPEAVLHNETGLVVNEENVTDVATAILSLLQSPATAAKLAARATERVHNEFTWNVMAARLQSWLVEVAGEPSVVRS